MELQLYWVSAITYAFILGVILFGDIKTTLKPTKLEKCFRQMTTWVIFFCLQDSFWGLCEAKVIENDFIFFLSSSVFHMSTVITTYFWLKYVLEYLDEQIKHKKLYLLLDNLVICFEFVLVAINCFKTTLFSITEGNYITGFLRPLTFINQYAVYLIIGIITLAYALKTDYKKDKRKAQHYRTVFFFTLAPILLGIFQLMFPNAPFFSLGYFLGCFIIYIFVIANDREVYLSKDAKLKKITKLNKELEEKQIKFDEQFEILKSVSGVFDYINLLDFETNIASRFDVKDSVSQEFDLVNDPHTTLNKDVAKSISEKDFDRFWTYTDLSTLNARLKGKKLISAEFKNQEDDWIRAMYIRIGDNVNRPISRVAYAMRNISNDRKREEQVYAAMANLVYSLHIFDLENDTMERLIESDILKQIIGDEESAQRMAYTIIRATSKDEFLDAMLEFVDLSTINERMKGKQSISCEFAGKYHGWTRMTFIPIEMKNNKVKRIVIITQIIDSEKTEMLNLLYKSSTDELTRLYNRRTYEDDLDDINEKKDFKNLIIIAMDVNGLKTINDTLGHKAGDELIIGASSCINISFSAVGKAYRTGGDEFMAILRCDRERLETVLKDFEAKCNVWSGNLVDKLSVSYGYVVAEDYPDISVRDIASEADKRMYEAKAEYYKRTGIDRRRR